MKILGWEFIVRRVVPSRLDMMRQKVEAAVITEQQSRAEANRLRDQLDATMARSRSSVEHLQRELTAAHGKHLELASKVDRQHFFVVRQKPMNEDQLTAAFKVDDKNELWVAVNQLIDTLERNCRIQEDESAATPEIAARFAGAAWQLDLLRDDFYKRRELSLGAVRRMAPARRNRFEREDET